MNTSISYSRLGSSSRRNGFVVLLKVSPVSRHVERVPLFLDQPFDPLAGQPSGGDVSYEKQGEHVVGDAETGPDLSVRVNDQADCCSSKSQQRTPEPPLGKHVGADQGPGGD